MEYKNIYVKMRKERGLTREKADEVLVGITAEKLERIENEKTIPSPDDINIMADGYNEPSLRNHYCANVCPIGIKKGIKEIQEKEISQIVLELLAFINDISKDKDRIIEVLVDGKVEDSEIKDFVDIQKKLSSLSNCTACLQQWTDNMVSSGMINKDKYNELINE